MKADVGLGDQGEYEVAGRSQQSVELGDVDIGTEDRGIGSEGRPQYPSELLYIVREANIVEELDEVLDSKNVELKEELDG